MFTFDQYNYKEYFNIGYFKSWMFSKVNRILGEILILPVLSCSVLICQCNSKYLEKFTSECGKIFKRIDGCLGVVDLSKEKIVISVNRNILLSKSFKPGSIFKIITTIAALTSGKINQDFEVECKGKVFFDDSEYKCWLPNGHKKINFTNAISQSCNIYFYTLADRLMIEDIYNVAESFYIGKRTPFKIADENPGIFKKTYLENERYNLAVGQSEDLLVTPVQILYMISVIAKRGKFLGFNRNLENNILQCLYDGLLLSIKEGTSKEANLIKYEIAGKTGTASKKIGKKTNSWFVGFAPFDNPEIAIVIFLKYGRGSIDASPIAKKVFKSYFNIYHSDNF